MAIPVTNAFKTAMKAPIKMLRATVSTIEGTPEVFTSADNLVSFNVQAVGYYFGTVVEQAEVKLIGTNYDLLNLDINVSFDAQTASGTWDTCDYGLFRVIEQTVDLEKGMTTIKALDMMGIVARTEYSVGDFTFPMTVAELAGAIAFHFGLELTTDMTTLPNYNYTITEDLYSKINNITYRDILAEIAGATATICAISSDDNSISFIPPQTTPGETWTYANLKKIKFEPKYGEVNAVVLARTPQEDNIVVRDEESIEANGLTEVKLANNEILDDDRQDLAQPILDAVDGFYFYPFEATTEGHGWHECGDRGRMG